MSYPHSHIRITAERCIFFRDDIPKDFKAISRTISIDDSEEINSAKISGLLPISDLNANNKGLAR